MEEKKEREELKAGESEKEKRDNKKSHSERQISGHSRHSLREAEISINFNWSTEDK